MESGRTLQRLFSTFPDRWPGLGLLLLRLCVAILVIALAPPDIPFQVAGPIALARDTVAIAGATFLLLGLWTPAISVITALDQLWVALSSHDGRHEVLRMRYFLAALAAALAMLGPGAWSFDARLFGRRRLDLRPGSGDKRPRRG